MPIHERPVLGLTLITTESVRDLTHALPLIAAWIRGETEKLGVADEDAIEWTGRVTYDLRSLAYFLNKRERGRDSAPSLFANHPKLYNAATDALGSGVMHEFRHYGTWNEVASASDGVLLRTPGMGRVRIKKLRDLLGAYGVSK